MRFLTPKLNILFLADGLNNCPDLVTAIGLTEVLDSGIIFEKIDSLDAGIDDSLVSLATWLIGPLLFFF